MIDKSVSAAVTRLFMGQAERHGIGPDEFRRATGIGSWEIEAVGARIPMAKHLAMLSLAQQLPYPREYFGQPMAARLQAFPTLYALVANAPTLGDALAAYLDYRVLIGNVDTLSWRREGTQFEFDYLLEHSGPSSERAFVNFVLLLDIVQHHDPQQGRATLLELTGNAFTSASLLRDEVGCEVRFGQARNRLRLRAPGADQSCAPYHPGLRAFFVAQARTELAGLQPTHRFAQQLEAWLADFIAAGEALAPDRSMLAHACEHFGTSRWTLHRRLQAEASCFQDVLVRVRFAAAQRLLRQTQGSVAEIGDLLGFSSTSAFSRFFATHSGLPPTRYKAGAAGSQTST